MSDRMMRIEPEITLKEAVQRRLAADLDADASLQERLEADPGAVVKPIIAELLGDDGDVDLSGVTTTVHIESDTDLHFVVTPGAAQADLDEVSGFAMAGAAGMLSGMSIGIDSIGGGLGAKTHTTPGDDRTRRCCDTSRPDTTTHRNCNSKKGNCVMGI